MNLYFDILIGILLIAMAFWAGTQADPMWGMAGFLPFFMAGTLLIIRTVEKIRKRRE